MGSDNPVLVTGANGFVGRALCTALAASGRRLRKSVRSPHSDFPDAVAVGDVGPETDWRAALEGVHCVAHLVSRTSRGRCRWTARGYGASCNGGRPLRSHRDWRRLRSGTLNRVERR